MGLLENELEITKKKQRDLELGIYNTKLQEKCAKLKELEGTVEVRVVKMNKSSRFVSLVHHIFYNILEDKWKKEDEIEHFYIGVKTRQITIHESPRKPYKTWELKFSEITPDSYNGKLHLEKENNSFDYATKKLVSIEVFNSIWDILKNTNKNILDGILDIKEVDWLFQGSESKGFENNEVATYQRIPLDIPHIFLTSEESYFLDNKWTRIFLHKNIYLISPNSLRALDEWFNDELESDRLAEYSCRSVGERWRGSRINEYLQLIQKIKKNVKMVL